MCSSRRMAKRCWLCASFVKLRQSPGGAGSARICPAWCVWARRMITWDGFCPTSWSASPAPSRVQVEVHCEPSVNLRRLLAEDRLDLALITCTPGAETSEVLRREPTVGDRRAPSRP